MLQKPILGRKKLLSLALVSLITPSVSSAKINLSNPLQKNWECSIKDGKWLCLEVNDDAQALFQKNTSISEKQIILSKALGWVPTNDPKNICGGYYYQPPTYNPNEPIDENTRLNADQAKYTVDGSISAKGNIEVQKGVQVLTANQAKVSPNPQTKQLQNIEASGNVNIRQPGQLVISKEGEANLNANTAVLTDTYYLIRVNENPTTGGSFLSSTPRNDTMSNSKLTHFTGYGRGHADVVHQLSKTHYVLKNATYTTAPPTADTWTLQGSTIDLNKETGRGEAYNAFLWAGDIPIFYSPFFNFPIDNRRQTGFLYPMAGYDSSSGYWISTPFYMNLAPNYDFLLTPTLYNHRGLMLNGNLRFLTDYQQGTIGLSYMPKDDIAQTSRSALDITTTGQYNKNWSSYFDYHYVSDDQFVNDFDSNDLLSANQTLLNREFTLTYADPIWNINTTLLDYNILDSTLTLANQPYATLPQITLSGIFPSNYSFVSYGINSQFTYFYKAPFNGQTQVNGQRLYNAPYIAFPFTQTWGYFTPKLTMTSTLYELQDREQIPGIQDPAFPDAYISRNLPIFDIDTGLYFDRQFNFMGTGYTQSLEPRLFYTYIPYDNQNNIPVFDSSFTNFSYSSLFQTNQFSGYDRINNANQLSYALETNITREDGKQILSGGIGQTAYFVDRKVSLCRTDGCIATENPFYQDKFSDVAAFGTYNFLDAWSFTTNLTYHAQTQHMDSQSYSLQYMPDPGTIFNIAYQNQSDDYSLLSTQQILDGTAPPSVSYITLSGLYQLTEHWSVVGLWNYAFNYNRTLNMFAGVSYDACSWSFRFLFQRYISNGVGSNSNDPSQISGPLSNSFVFQVELKGLGGSSASQLQGLLTQINGYTPESPF